MNGLALCAGVGGLELGLHLAIGRTYRTVGYVEREAYAAAALVARMEDAALDPAPIFDDLSRFDSRPWRGVVDIVSAGIPCQPYSAAGQQHGHADERALWPHLVRIVAECEPGLVFIENVPPFLGHAEPVWRQLLRLGFVWAPPLLATASHFGAPHARERVFMLAAHPDRQGLEGRSLRDGRCSDKRPSGASYCEIAGTFRGQSEPWATESPVCRVDDGVAGRMDRLRAAGNGVIPLVAANAFRLLAGQLSA